MMGKNGFGFVDVSTLLHILPQYLTPGQHSKKRALMTGSRFRKQLLHLLPTSIIALMGCFANRMLSPARMSRVANMPKQGLSSLR